jgi:hypothetical protein
MRQGVSIGLTYFIFYLLLNKKYLSSIVTYFISLNFHLSSIVSICSVFFLKRINVLVLYFSLFISIIISFIPSIQIYLFNLFDFIIPSKYTQFLLYQLSSNTSSFGIRNIFLSLLAILLIFSLKKAIYKYQYFFIQISVFGIILNNLFGLFELLSRVVIYFTPALCVSIPISYSLLFKGRNRIYINIITILCMFFFFARAVLTDNLGLFHV